VVMRRYTAALAVLAIAFSVSAAAQQKPLTAAEKAAAEQQAGVEAMAKMAAQQAEAVARAQQKVAEESQRRALEAARADAEKMNVVVPLDLEVVISRYQGDKKTSSLPYALTVNAKYVGDVEGAPTTSLRMGGEVPLPTMSLTLDGKPIPGIPTGGPVLYKAVGTNIDARARILDGGRFEIWVSVQDDAIATPQSVGAGTTTNGLPVIRSFRASNNVVLRDGVQLITALVRAWISSNAASQFLRLDRFPSQNGQVRHWSGRTWYTLHARIVWTTFSSPAPSPPLRGTSISLRKMQSYSPAGLRRSFRLNFPSILRQYRSTVSSGVSFKCSARDVQTAMEADGLVDSDVDGDVLVVPVTITVGGRVTRLMVPMTYTAEAGVSGHAVGKF